MLEDFEFLGFTDRLTRLAIIKFDDFSFQISRETLEFLRNEERGCVAKDTWLAKTDRDAEAMIAVSFGTDAVVVGSGFVSRHEKKKKKKNNRTFFLYH